MTVAAITEPAPAKLNLDLYVEGRRTDGYHLLDSITTFTAFGDTLKLAPAAVTTLTLDGPLAVELEAAGETLVKRALAGLASACGHPCTFKVTLTKRIPLAAGLGGGSADAAAALRAAGRVLGLGADDPMLVTVAAGLGADVPACLAARPVRMRGIGDRLEPAPAIPPLAIVLANPRTPAPTAQVYRALDAATLGPAPARDDGPDFVDQPGAGQPLPRWLIEGRNDLEAAALRVAPVIGEVLGALRATGAPVVRLCGSGATAFAAFAAMDEAMGAAAALRAAHPHWWIETSATP